MLLLLADVTVAAVTDTAAVCPVISAAVTALTNVTADAAMTAASADTAFVTITVTAVTAQDCPTMLIFF